ncbi:DUF2867 domain-containing protein [Methylobacterium sp. W2]|uniref:DUF2867 domain-containing protein n=1 Tax=Methylobacterium sp. W2 TaxID=2598107 RepID=UPI0029CAB033|nr:DUF2867 domain-containing protein [Methylobacterium sp. W2]
MSWERVAADPLVRPPRPRDDYDTRSVVLPAAISPIHAWDVVSAEPRPLLALAFRVRDAIAARFGVKAIGGFAGERRLHVREGDRLDVFLVEHSAPDMLLLTARDRHLDVMICLGTCGHRLTIT